MFNRNRRAFKYLIFLLLFLFGCDEFYDEEYEEFNEDTPISTRENNRLKYTAELFSTDPNLNNPKGFVTIDIESETAKIDLTSDGIPQNCFQMSYTYSSISCETLSFPKTEEEIGERSFSIQEAISTDALSKDLKMSGASEDLSDINLNGKYFLVQAQLNESDQPNESGSTRITILCGILETSESEGEDSQDEIDVLNVPPQPPQPTPPTGSSF